MCLNGSPNFRITMDTLVTDIVPLMRDIDDAIDESEEQIY
jgi:hypothetical protein